MALVGRNSSNWAICFFGILAYGAVAVPILHEFKPDNIHHIVNHSEAKAVLAASSNWENMNERMMPDVKLFMMLDNFSIIHSKSKEVRVVRDRINEYFGKKYPRSFTSNDVRYHVEKPEELAVLNYTSGTTSFSKGVMIPIGAYGVIRNSLTTIYRSSIREIISYVCFRWPICTDWHSRY